MAIGAFQLWRWPKPPNVCCEAAIAQSPILNWCETTMWPHSSNAEAAQRKLVPEITVASKSTARPRFRPNQARHRWAIESARVITHCGKIDHAAE